MYLPGEPGSRFEALAEQCNRLARHFDQHRFPDSRHHFLPGAELGQTVAPGDLLRIETGVVYLVYRHRTLVILQPGDIVCPLVMADSGGALHYVAEEKVTVAKQSASEFLTQLTSNPDQLALWFELQVTVQRLFMELYGEHTKIGVRPQAGFLRFAAGECILREGTEADYAYTLLKGRAVVSVGDQKVGIVEEGEIFGALAVLNGRARNASVYAKTDCTAMAVPADQFIDLIQAHPETSLRLVKAMARQIEELNRRVTGAPPSPL